MATLGVNIDHVATLRQARYRGTPDPARGEPNPSHAVHVAELAGAECITMHLREDRRHVNDRDVQICRDLCRVKFNLEMGATDEMVAIAARLKPHMSTLVPEGREEVTTEGGLDVAGQKERMIGVVSTLRDAGVSASAFIDADVTQIRAAADVGFEWCEVHTGPYAEAFMHAGGDPRDPALAAALARVAAAGRLITELGMRFNAGHALNYANVRPIATLPGVEELHIGHSIVSRAVYTGLHEAVATMRSLIAG